MPYIKSEQRPLLLSGTVRAASPGEANYLLTKSLHTIIGIHGLNYTNTFLVNLAIDVVKTLLNKPVVSQEEVDKLAADKSLGKVYHDVLYQLILQINNLLHLHDTSLDEEGLYFIALLNDVQREFNRVVVAPYEDQKRKENGSVSELDKVLNDKRAH